MIRKLMRYWYTVYLPEKVSNISGRDVPALLCTYMYCLFLDLFWISLHASLFQRQGWICTWSSYWYCNVIEYLYSAPSR